MSEQLNGKIKTATKWSAITQVIAKLVAPITNMVLARMLTPDAFGIISTIHMIISFAEIFTDAGFQKYIVQHQYRDEKHQDESVNVAFWSNFTVSLFIWAIIALFCNPLAELVGNPGLGYVIVIACISIPLASFSSIQMALYRRNLDFKTLFKVKIVGVLIPLVITIPLAFFLRSFWALLIGILAKDVANAFILTYYSQWKPRFFYSLGILKEMFSFTMWSMIEHISIWLTVYVDVFIVGTMLSQHYLGLYKTSSNVVNQVMSLITVTTTPILFSSLSRLQDNIEEFKLLFFKFQKMVAMLVIPIGVGIFCFSDLVTKIMLGEQWLEASNFIGLWGLTSSISIVLSNYCSEVYRALGKPKLSVLAQWLHIIVLWPTVIISVRYGFETLYVNRAIVRLQMILVNLLILHFVIRISIRKMILNIGDSLVAASIMGGGYLLVKTYLPQTLYMEICCIPLCVVVYFAIMLRKTEHRELLLSILKKGKKKK